MRQWRHDLSEIAVDNLLAIAGRISGNPTVQKDYSTIGGAEMSGSDVLHVAGEDQLAGGQLKIAYEAHLFTNTCVNYIAGKRAGVPLKFYRREIENGESVLKPADDHPVAQAFALWNPHMTDLECFEWVESWALLAGKGSISISPPGPDTPKGIPFELWPLYPNGLTPIRNKSEGLIGYQYHIEGSAINLLPEEVLEVREFSTGPRFTAMGRLYAGRSEILTDLRARKWNDELLKHGVHIAGTLETDEELNADTAKAIGKTFHKQYGSANNAGRVAVLWDGLKFKPHTLAHKDIGFIEQLNLTKTDIAMAFGLPLELLGEKSANFASLQEKRRIFWQDVMVARGQRFERVLNSNFLPRIAPELFAAYDYSDVEAMQPDRGELIKVGKEAIAGAMMTPNEVRVKNLDLEPIVGGDVLWIGRGLLPVEAALAEAAAADEPQDGEGQRSDSRRGSIARALKSYEDRSTGVVKAISPVEKALRALLKITEIRMQNILNEEYRAVERSVEAAVIANDLAEIEELIKVTVRDAVVARTKDTLHKAAKKAFGIVDNAIGITGRVDLRNTLAEKILKGHEKRITDISKRQFEFLKETLREGLADGDSEAEMSQRVQHFFRNERSNALTIARTESSQAVNSGAMSSMENAREEHGIKVKAVWQTVVDENTRDGENGGPDHVAAHGLKVIPGKELFVVSGEKLRFPGDTENGSLANTISCRCSVTPEVEAKR